MTLDRIDTVLAWLDRVLARSRAVLAIGRWYVAELREPEPPAYVFEDRGPCVRCHDPLGRGLCDDCARDLALSRETRV